MKIWTDLSFLCHSPRVWQTDGQTYRILMNRPRLHSMQRGKNEENISYVDKITQLNSSGYIYGTLCGSFSYRKAVWPYFFAVSLKCVIMSGTFRFAIMVGGLIVLSSVQVNTQSTLGDSASCESSTFNEGVNLIREDLKDMKNLLRSRQEDLKAACASNQQQTALSTSKQAFVSSLLCEYDLRHRRGKIWRKSS